MRRIRHGSASLGDRAGRGRRRQSGQSLVEFALVIPIFMLLVVAIAEFSFMFASYLSAGFATRDGVQAAAEQGNSVCADETILQRIDNDTLPPVDKNRILRIEIFWADTDGSSLGTNQWIRGGSHSCTLPDSTVITVPYTQNSNGYAVPDRCNILSGADCAPGHSGIDTIGVKIVYDYQWITPLPGMIGASPTGIQMVESNMMRLEPVK